MNGIIRRVLYVGLEEVIPVVPFREPPERNPISQINFEIDFAFAGTIEETEYTTEMFLPLLHKNFDNHFFSKGQKIVLKREKTDLQFHVKSIENADVEALKSQKANLKSTPGNSKNKELKLKI